MEKSMSETEKEIMEVFWNRNCSITSQELLQFFNQEKGKEWKIQTLSTFLARLCKKNLLKGKQKGKNYMYWSILTKQEYKQRQANFFLETMYGGSVTNFISALGGKEQLNKEDISCLKEWLNDMGF